MSDFYPDDFIIRKSSDLPEGVVFTFGSNLAARHGKGAALTAYRHFGATKAAYGGYGHHGRSYAIPTKDYYLNPLTLDEINSFVKGFVNYTKNSPHRFFVTKIGTGLAGFRTEEIAPLFKGAGDNCLFAESWAKYF